MVNILKKVNFKRAGFAVLAGLMMAGSAGIPIHASETSGPTDITIKNAETGKVYEAYKVFDGTQSGDKFAYTIKKSSPFYDVVSTYDGIKLEKAAGTADTYIVTMTDSFDATKFASLLRADETKGKPFATSNDYNWNGKEHEGTAIIPIGEFQDESTSIPSVRVDAAGYFYVNTEMGTIASLGASKDQNVTVVDKNRDIFTEIDPEAKGNDNKNFRMEIDDHDAEEGQVVNYTVHSVIPSTDGFNTYTYTIADTLPAGLQLDADSVKVNAGDLDASAFTITPSDNGYTVTIDAKKLNGTSGQDAFGKKFTITYSAKVLDAAVDVRNTDNVQLMHSTIVNGNTTSADLHTDDETVYTGKAAVVKVDANTTYADKAYGTDGKKLSGAQFVLSNEDGTKFYKIEDGKVTWVEAANGEAAKAAGATVVTTDTDGAAEFKGLEAKSDDSATDKISALGANGVGTGKYRLYEIEAPKGYNLLKDPVEVSLVRTGDTITSETYVVENSSGIVLPGTGSRNAMILTVVGAAGVGAIAIYLATKKKEEQPQA